MANEYKNVTSSKKKEANKIMTEEQIAKCNVAIHTAAVAAGAEAIIPLPGVDAVPITATQITMIVALGKVFDKKISESAAKAVIGAAASTFVGRSLVKLIPIVGWAVSSAVAAGVTEAIGWTVAVDFANNKPIEDSSNQSDSTEESDDVNEDSAGTEEDSSGDVSPSDKADATESKDEESKKKDDSDLDDESISNDFSKLFGEDNE